MKIVSCATYEGFDAKSVNVEVSLTRGLPSFNIVGMASTAITEAKERVKSALLCNKYMFPPKRITVNLAPSDVKKGGSQFDLSIALLIATQDYNVDFTNWYVFGELGLDGSVKENMILYPLVLSLANQEKISKVVVPYESVQKLSNIPGIELYGVHNLQEAIELFMDSSKFEPTVIKKDIRFNVVRNNKIDYFFTQEYKEDFSDVKGQEHAKRAALIAACGFHNIVYEGSPGCGKSMIAKRLRYILPPVESKEILEIAKLDVLDCKTPHFKPKRSMRSPHHTSTMSSIFGGGSHNAKIGEVGLANKGILFFDELPHFSKNVLEALREPMQDNLIRISRVNSKVEYPADFLFVGAMNPCPCGNLLNSKKECRCTELEIKKYKNRLSDPFLDRVDLNVIMGESKHDDHSSYTSMQLHQMVIDGFMFAKKRGQKKFNAKLSESEIERFCTMDQQASASMNLAIERFGLSFRGVNKVKKVSRTIADLDQSEVIKNQHLLEALSYRKR